MEHHAHFTLETTGLGNTIPSMLPAKSWREWFLFLLSFR
jgi:hypothetical protein